MAKFTPMRAIRQKCLECSAGSTKEIKECPVLKCGLYAYRSGHSPKDEEFTVDGSSEEKSADTAGFIGTETKV